MRVKGVRGLNYLLLFVFAVMFSFTSLWATTGYEKEIDNISKTMADKIAAAGKKKVAVVDFTDLQGNVTELGRFIAEEFFTSLLIAKKGFTVIDRTHLNALLKEHKLSAKGLIDPTTAKKLGKIAGPEALITGTLTPLKTGGGAFRRSNLVIFLPVSFFPPFFLKKYSQKLLNLL
jgi:curli biogenesis system outer membrane secretion channel CsgG